MVAFSYGQQAQKTQAPYNILLIEDDEATGEMLIECIESESPFRVRSLSSGEEVIQHLTVTEEIHANLRNHKVTLLTKPFELTDLLSHLDYIQNNSNQQLI